MGWTSDCVIEHLKKNSFPHFSHNLNPDFRKKEYKLFLKVGEVVVNPFGEDDDDWESNALIDRNITVIENFFWEASIEARF